MHDCEVVVVDLNMPNVDGISLILYIRERPTRLPIVVFTGAGYEEDRNACRVCEPGRTAT